MLIIGATIFIFLIVFLTHRSYFIKKKKKNKNLRTEQANGQNKQPFKLVSLRNDEQQRVETNKNEARLSLNNNINKNDINIIPTIQNTENEIIPSNENFQEKK